MPKFKFVSSRRNVLTGGFHHSFPLPSLDSGLGFCRTDCQIHCHIAHSSCGWDLGLSCSLKIIVLWRRAREIESEGAIAIRIGSLGRWTEQESTSQIPRTLNKTDQNCLTLEGSFDKEQDLGNEKWKTLDKPIYDWKTSKKGCIFVRNPTTNLWTQKTKVFWQSFCEIKSEYGMPYLVEPVIKIPIDWHSSLETLIFDRFLQK